MKWEYVKISGSIIDENNKWVADLSNEEEGERIVKIHNAINEKVEDFANNEYPKTYHRVGTADGWHDGFVYAINLLKNI